MLNYHSVLFMSSFFSNHKLLKLMKELITNYRIETDRDKKVTINHFDTCCVYLSNKNMKIFCRQEYVFKAIFGLCYVYQTYAI